MIDMKDFFLNSTQQSSRTVLKSTVPLGAIRTGIRAKKPGYSTALNPVYSICCRAEFSRAIRFM